MLHPIERNVPIAIKLFFQGVNISTLIISLCLGRYPEFTANVNVLLIGTILFSP